MTPHLGMDEKVATLPSDRYPQASLSENKQYQPVVNHSNHTQNATVLETCEEVCTPPPHLPGLGKLLAGLDMITRPS